MIAVIPQVHKTALEITTKMPNRKQSKVTLNTRVETSIYCPEYTWLIIHGKKRSNALDYTHLKQEKSMGSSHTCQRAGKLYRTRIRLFKQPQEGPLCQAQDK